MFSKCVVILVEMFKYSDHMQNCQGCRGHSDALVETQATGVLLKIISAVKEAKLMFVFFLFSKPELFCCRNV